MLVAIMACRRPKQAVAHRNRMAAATSMFRVCQPGCMRGSGARSDRSERKEGRKEEGGGRRA